jgi:alpha-1,3-rhamnosyl/mannosyltransferase
VKIILDVSSVSAPLSGIGRYTLELAKGLQKQSDISELLYYRNGNLSSVFEMAVANQSLPYSKKNFKRYLKIAPIVRFYRYLQKLKSYSKLKNYNSYCFHATNFSLPLIKGMRIATVHDLSVFLYPDFHPKDRVNYLKREIYHSVKTADLVVTDSFSVRDEIVSYFNLPLSLVQVVPLAANQDYKLRTSAETLDVLTRYKLRHKKYFLIVATIEPRKNHAALFESYLKLSDDIQQEYPMIVIGAYGWNGSDVLRDIATFGDDIIYLQYVDEIDLPYLYSGAKIFFFLSYYEGFGLPVLEAMQSGVPVICSNINSLVELSGDAAICVDPNDITAIVAATEKLIYDSSSAANLVKLGIENAKKYSWNNTVEKMKDCYNVVSAMNKK